MELIFSKATFDIDGWHALLYLIYTLSSIFLLMIFGKIYVKFTPYNELDLIRSGNMAVAIAFSGAMIGFCINLGFTIAYSHNYTEYLMYAVFSMLVQLFCYKLITIIFKDFSSEIVNFGNIPVSIFYASIAICIGILNGVSGV